jgi:alkylation response protein AidB-like acyl-CoA dehydrogenase
MSDDVGGLDTVLVELRDWLQESWDPNLLLRDWWQRLAESGWGYPHFPTEWYGRGLTPATAGACSREIRDFGAVPAPTGFGPGMAAPTVIDHGTDEQRRRHLPGILSGADAYCQLFSEPNAGSDLAGLQCRAERDGETWVVNGQKVWTSSAQIANKAMLVARTNVDVPKHAGISYFFVDLEQQGVEIRPIKEITGRSYFNEVFLTDVRIPAVDLIGGEGNGWAVANTTLAYERGRRNTGGVGPYAAPGPVAGDLGRTAGDVTRPREPEGRTPTPPGSGRLAALARALTRDDHPGLQDDLVRLYFLERVNAMNGQRARAMGEQGLELAGLPNLTKMTSNNLIRFSRHVTLEVLGQRAMLFGYDIDSAVLTDAMAGAPGVAEVMEVAVFASAPPIYGGSDQIQHNIVGERVLGLPREPNDDRAVPFKDLKKN